MASNDGVTFRQMLHGERFYYGVEVVTTRGFQLPDTPNNLASFASELLNDPRVGWISITDNPGGGPMLPPDWLAGTVAGPPRSHNIAHDLQGPQPQRPGSLRLALCG